MANITHDSAVVNRIAGEIDGDITKIRESLNKLDAILEDVRTAWSGADATSYYTKAVDKKAGMIKVVDVLAKMPEKLREIARMMNAAEGDLAQK